MTRSNLDDIAERVDYDEGLNSRLIEYRFETLAQYFTGETCLEFGCANGVMTRELVSQFDAVTAVDGSERFCEETRDRVDAVNVDFEVVNALFTEFECERRYDTVILAHVLEHVQHPVAVLEKARSCVSDSGIIIVDVPNANSLHRQAGVELGMLDHVAQLNDLDRKLGHERVYDWATFRKDITAAGLRVVESGGVFLKPLSNSQIEERWAEDLIDAYYELGKKYPEIAAEIYAVSEK